MKFYTSFNIASIPGLSVQLSAEEAKLIIGERFYLASDDEWDLKHDILRLQDEGASVETLAPLVVAYQHAACTSELLKIARIWTSYRWAACQEAGSLEPLQVKAYSNSEVPTHLSPDGYLLAGEEILREEFDEMLWAMEDASVKEPTAGISVLSAQLDAEVEVEALAVAKPLPLLWAMEDASLPTESDSEIEEMVQTILQKSEKPSPFAFLFKPISLPWEKVEKVPTVSEELAVWDNKLSIKEATASLYRRYARR